jgi:spermidine/putrescine transport system substrate-binding protein
VGILYNTQYVDEEDVTGWELLWNEKYEGKILMFDNSRDAFGIAQFLLGYDINTTDEAELQHCADVLAQQKPIVQQYVMDQVFNSMENEEAWIAPYYAGDCMVMMENNENLAFYLPEDQGFNLFIDAMCIPTCCQEKEAAELFINFLCDPEIAGANMDWICYSTPLSAAKAYMDPEMINDPVAYPSDEVLANGVSYTYLPEEVSRYVEGLFMQVRNG